MKQKFNSMWLELVDIYLPTLQIGQYPVVAIHPLFGE